MIYRKVPFINYVKFGLIVFFTLLISIIIFIVYNNYKNYIKSIPILRGVVTEINIEDVDNYIEENENLFLYFGAVDDKNSIKLEKKLARYVKNDNLDFIYVNFTNVEDKYSFYDKFNKKYSYSYNNKIFSFPAFIYIKNKKIEEIVQKNGTELFIYDILDMIKTYQKKGEKDA